MTTSPLHNPTLPLLRHQDSTETNVVAVFASCAMTDDGAIALAFRVDGDIDAIAIPDAAKPGQRKDGLWRETCFELFLKSGNDKDYTEINISPSSDWAAYRFTDYRSQMSADNQASLTKFSTSGPLTPFRNTSYTLNASFAVPKRRQISPATTMINLSSIIKDKSGATSYWALDHAPGAPDFHHPTCFKSDLLETSHP